MQLPEDIRLDKAVLTVAPLESSSDEKAYWHAQTPYDRMRALELLRQLNHADYQPTARLQ